VSALGLYVPGVSPVHRLCAGTKLLLMLLAGAGSVLVDHAWQAALAVLIVLGGYLLARLPLAIAARQARPVLWILGFVAVFHVLASGWERAAVFAGVILALVLLAALVTLTTRTSDMIDALVRAMRPLRVLGVHPERVGLLLALSIRSVPVIVTLAEEVRDAQRARGLTASPRAFAVPLIVRSLRHADALGDALVARGADDD
jgi:biotin transport system permease protein